MKKLQLLGAMLACYGFVSTSHAAVIDFNDVPTVPQQATSLGSSYTEDGYTVSIFRIGILAFEDGFQNNSSSSNGTTFVGAYSELGIHDVEFSIAESTGELFTISSIDLGEAFNESDTERYDWNGLEGTILGYKADGSLLAALFTLDGISDGIGGVEDFETLAFGSEWTNLMHVDFRFKNQGTGFTTTLSKAMNVL